MFFIFKQHVKSGEGTVDAGNVLLQVYLFFIIKIFITVNILLKYAEPLSRHNYLMKKYFDWDFFWF